MEEFLKKQLSKEYQFIGEAIYREAVISNALESNPDVLVLRETLNGSTDILDIVYEVRLQLPDARIVFLASERNPGDSLLAELVGNGVYDILAGNKLSAPDIMTLIREPNKFSDVAMYRPKLNLTKAKEKVFEAPPVTEVVKQVKETVFVEGDVPILPPDFGQSTDEEEEEEPVRKRKAKRNRRRFLKKKDAVEEDDSQNHDILHPSENKEEEPTFNLKPVIPAPTLPEKETPKPIAKPKRNIAFPQKDVSMPKSKSVEVPEVPTFAFTPPETDSEVEVEEPKLDFNPEPITKPVEEKQEIPEEKELPVFTPTVEPPKVQPTFEAKPPVVEPQRPQPVVEKPQTMPQTPQPQQPMQTSFGNGRQKIITFVGGEHGVGNSQVAFNTSLSLAKKGFKTIFIELKEQGSTMEYLYQLAVMNKGLDYALNHMREENLAGLQDSIIHLSDIRSAHTSNLMTNTYQKLPEALSYLFFSPDYILERDPERKTFDPLQLKELCMHLLFQEGYHYIILDVEPDLYHPLSEVALGFGTHVFFTLTQDVTHVGRAVRNISEINKRINIVDKLYYIVNKYEKQAALTKKDLGDWLGAEVETTIPIDHREFIDSNMNGMPLYLFTKNKAIKQGFDEVVDHILKK